VSAVDDFLDSLRRVAAGGAAIDPEDVGQVMGRRRARDPLEDLSPREREVLGLMAEGLANHGICERLVLSPKTIETHVNSIFTKLRLAPAADDHRRVLAVLTFLGGAAWPSGEHRGINRVQGHGEARQALRAGVRSQRPTSRSRP